MICVLSTFLDIDYWIQNAGLAKLIDLGISRKKFLVETETRLLFAKILMNFKRIQLFNDQ